MGSSAKLRWKKYLNELRFLYEELDFVKEITKESAQEFQAHYEEYCRQHDIDLRALNKRNSQRIQQLYTPPTPNHADENAQLESEINGALIPYDESLVKDVNREQPPPASQQYSNYQMTQDEIEIYETFHKVFRKIALQIHPDKLDPSLSLEEKREKLNSFTKAKAALEEKRYFILLEMAANLNISVPRNYRQQIRWMKKELVLLEENIKKEKNTYNYIFSECDDDDEKDAMIKRFMVQIFGPQIFEIMG